MPEWYLWSMETKFADYLAELKRADGTTHADYGKRIRVSQAAVTRYAKGDRIPRRAVIDRIVKESGGKITAGDFYPPAPAQSAPIVALASQG